jgi:hypothetical protein
MASPHSKELHGLGQGSSSNEVGGIKDDGSPSSSTLINGGKRLNVLMKSAADKETCSYATRVTIVLARTPHMYLGLRIVAKNSIASPGVSIT